ncbi:MAG: hypothetical protein L6V93_02550 [Clostridiales bacterium]|nr:MAG: hypothetical protein L6V93_02550 [Clostridiales bacterium]
MEVLQCRCVTKDLVFKPLSDYITPDKFRLIGEEMREIPMGNSEFAAEVQLKKENKRGIKL